MNDVYVGTFTGAATAVNVECGFVPDVVILFEGDTPSFAISLLGGAGVEQAAGVTALTASDLTELADEDDGYGFTVKAGAAINVTAVTTNFIAMRSNR